MLLGNTEKLSKENVANAGKSDRQKVRDLRLALREMRQSLSNDHSFQGKCMRLKIEIALKENELEKATQ